MLFLYLSYCYCKTEYNFLEGELPSGLQLFLDPLDIVEIKMRSRSGVLISDWGSSENVYLYVDGKNRKKQKLKYGPFDKNSGLSKICFSNYNFLIRVMNDGPDLANITFRFNSFFSDDMNINSPLEFNNDTKTFIVILIVMPILLTVLALFPLFCGCKDWN